MAGRPRMVLLVDENVPASVADFLNARGYEVRLVREHLSAGTPDPVVAAVAAREEMVWVMLEEPGQGSAPVREGPRRAALEPPARVSLECEAHRARQVIEKWVEVVEEVLAGGRGALPPGSVLRLGERGVRLYEPRAGRGG